MRKENNILKGILGFVPILNWLPMYSFRNNLINDIIGGLTVGIMHVPQGMAYSSLAGVRPINGLYTSLFPAIFYMIFGTSKHVSLGVFAVVTLLSGSCNIRVSNILMETRNHTGLDDEQYDEVLYNISLEVLSALTLFVGIIQLCMAVFRLDFFISFLSDQIIAGFTTGAAVHVFVAQMNKFLGVALPRHSGFAKLYFVLQDLYHSVAIGDTNYVTLGISILTICALYIMKNCVDPIYKKKCSIPIPYELFVMIFGTVFSGLFDLHDQFDVKIIGVIPSNIPTPALPNISLFHNFVSDAAAIAVISIVVTVSMGKLFAKKHDYKIDVRQEFYAMGIMECLTSLFPVWPSSTALARTLVYEAAGTKTQLATVFSSALLLCVIFLVGPYVEVLPVCYLSCIIVVSLRGMFMQLGCIPVLWKSSRIDCIIFLFTFVCTVVLEVVEGLILGVIFALAVLVCNTLTASVVELEPTDEEHVHYKPVSDDRSFNGKGEVKVVHFSSPLIFLNVENFRKTVDEIVKDERSTLDSCSVEIASNKVKTPIEEGIPVEIRALVVDLSKIPYIDYSGVQALLELVNDYRMADIAVLFADVPSHISKMLNTSPDFKDLKHRIYPTIQKAIEGNNT